MNIPSKGEMWASYDHRCYRIVEVGHLDNKPVVVTENDGKIVVFWLADFLSMTPIWTDQPPVPRFRRVEMNAPVESYETEAAA